MNHTNSINGRTLWRKPERRLFEAGKSLLFFRDINNSLNEKQLRKIVKGRKYLNLTQAWLTAILSAWSGPIEEILLAMCLCKSW